MILPINNQNVSLWRDDPRAIDTADFDPKFIEYDREKRTKYFTERYTKAKELTSSDKREILDYVDNKGRIEY